MADQQSILSRVLDPPAYGFERNGQLYVPSHAEIVREFFGRLNIFHSRKNWLSFFGWLSTLSFTLPLGVYFVRFFSWPIALAGFIYGAVILGSHGTFWLHRYSTHRAFCFRNALVREICRNLVIKIIPEETYVISHQFSNADLSSNKYKTAARSKENTLALANAQAIAYCEKYGRKARPVEGEIKLEPYRTQPLFGLDFAPLDRAWYGYQKKYWLTFTMSCFDPLKNEQTSTAHQAPLTSASAPSGSSTDSESAESSQEASTASFQ
jgi:hypothetical protein